MGVKRFISVLLLAIYLFATGSNTLGVMLCDCAAHSRYDTCCGHSHKHSHHAHICSSDHTSANFTAHCSCTHRHGEADPCILSTNGNDDEFFKYFRQTVGDCQYVADVETSAGDAFAAAISRTGDRIPVVRPPLMSAGAPRAPSFLA